MSHAARAELPETCDDLTVRVGKPEDFVSLNERAAETILSAFDHPDLTAVQRAENQRVVAMTQQSCLAAVKDANCEVFVATSAGRLAGFVIVAAETEPHAENWFEIGWFVVFSEFQGRGVAQGLMEAALEWVGANSVQLGVIHCNARAAAFYEKYGFEDTGQLIEGHEIPRKLMVRRTY